MAQTREVKSSTPFKLIMGFGVILLFLLSISLMGLYMVSQLIQAQESIVNEYNEKKDITERMMAFAQRRFLVIARMINKKDIFDIEDLKMERMEYGAHFVYHLERLVKMPLNEQEKSFIAKIRRTAGHSSRTVDKLVEKIEKNDNRIFEIFDKVAMPTQEKVHKALLEFGNLQYTYSREMAKRSEQMRDQFFVLQIIVTVLLISLGGYLAFFVTRKIVKTENQLFVQRKQAITTLGSISDCVISTSHDSKVIYINQAAEILFSIKLEQAIGKPVDQIVPLRDKASVRICLECVFGGSCKSLECPKEAFDPIYIDQHGNSVILEIERSAIFDDTNRFQGYVIVLRDVTQKRQSERLLEKQAKSDNLTNLANRVSFEEQLREIVYQDEPKHNLLCYMDLDRFKIINDTCGHVAGDELLKQVAKILQQNGRKSDVLARIGGDEFVLIMKDCDVAAGQRFAKSIINDISNYKFVWENQSFSIGISIGIVLLDAKIDVEDALKAADRACYRAKGLGRNTYCVFDPDDHEIIKHTSEVEWCNNINRAIKDDSFVLFGQPIVKVGDTGNHSQMVEVLLRYDDNGIYRSASEFIPAAERYNLINEIDYWVVDKIFTLLTEEKIDFVVNINVSAQSVSNRYFRNHIINRIRQLNINAGLICFEIFETTAVANILDLTEFVQELKSIGCKFAITDFGNGVSSFGYLQALPIDYIKINGEIIRELVESDVHYHMAESIHNIANLMSITTIAEHVTRKEEEDCIEKIGIDYVQGYYISEPQLLYDLIHQTSQQKLKA